MKAQRTSIHQPATSNHKRTLLLGALTIAMLIAGLAASSSAQARWVNAPTPLKQQLHDRAYKGQGEAKVTKQVRWLYNGAITPSYGVVCGYVPAKPSLPGAAFYGPGFRNHYRIDTPQKLNWIRSICS